MKKYSRIYKKLLTMNAQMLTAYRANFINSLISSVVWGSITFISILLLTSRISSVNGWTRTDLLLLTAVYNIVIGSFHTIFSRNFDRFSRLMHMGEFDSLLLKPVDAQFSISFWLFNYTGMFRIIVGLIVAGIILNTKLVTNIYIIPAFIFVSIFGVCLMYCIWFLVSTLMVKYTNLSNLVEVLFQINGFGRYPMDIYRGVGVLAFSLIVPLTVAVTVPAKVLTQKAALGDFLMLILITAGFLLATRYMWKFALRFYTSASG